MTAELTGPSGVLVAQQERDCITAVLNMATVLLVVLDAHGRIVRFNRACEQTTGYSSRELEGRHWWEILSPADCRDAVSARFQTLDPEQFPQQDESVWLTRQGEPRLIAWSHTALLDGAGAIKYIVSAGVDMTERRQAEAELKQYHDSLEELIQARTAELARANRRLEQEIDQRRQIEKALRESQANLANAQRIARLGSWEWDIVTGTVTWSDETYRIIGLAPAQPASYQALLNAVHPADRDRFNQAIQHALYECKPYAIEFRLLRADGVESVVHSNAEVYCDGHGEALRLVGTLQDVTAHKQAEEALQKAHEELERRVSERTHALQKSNDSLRREIAVRQQAEEKLQQTKNQLTVILESLPVVSYTSRLEGLPAITYISKNVETLTGFTPEQLINYKRFWIDHVHPDDAPRMTAKLAELASRGYQENEYRWRAADGSYRWIYDFSRVIENGDGGNRVVGMCQDITERREADSALRASEARLRAIASAVPDLIMVLDEDGRYVEILTRRQELLYADPQELRGKFVSDVFSPEKTQYFLDHIAKTLSSGKPQSLEYDLYISAVGQRWFEARMAPIEVQAAAKPAVVLVARDITQRKAAEEQLRQAQKMEAIGHLTGGVAHDFNNLLAIVMGNLELLDEDLTPNSGLRDLVRRALAAANRGAVLTQRLLAFSRQQPLQARPTDLNKLVAGMIDLLRRTLGETIQIQMLLAGDLWRILIDPAQFENAVLNLALNARDAMPQGGRLVLKTANCRLDESYAAVHEAAKPGDYVMLMVSDTGVGMTKPVLERAVEPFFTTKEVGKGSGLGLSMVYGLVKQSGGHVMLDSEVDRGTTVTVYLPQTVSEQEILLETSTAEPLQTGRAETILVVEDDASVRQLAVSMLKSLGYATIEAWNARGALQLLDEQPQVALLFTDVVLPGGMNGAELAREAQQRRPELKVLFTSGYTESALVNDGRLEEGVELLPKPYRKADLAARLRAMLTAEH